jgi:hypothetical protein
VLWLAGDHWEILLWALVLLRYVRGWLISTATRHGESIFQNRADPQEGRVVPAPASQDEGWINRLSPAGTLPLEVRSRTRAGRFPKWFEPMKAKLAHEPFSREGWLFEPKLDGMRCLVYRNGKDLELWSRSHQRLKFAGIPS